MRLAQFRSDQMPPSFDSASSGVGNSCGITQKQRKCNIDFAARRCVLFFHVLRDLYCDFYSTLYNLFTFITSEIFLLSYLKEWFTQK